MSDYHAPLTDLLFATEHLADLAGVAALPEHADLNIELIEAILQEAAKFGMEVLAPLNQPGDQQGATLCDGVVRTPDGWKAAYQLFIDGGWNGLPFAPGHGGQGLPWLVATAVQEIWHATNMAFALCPLLTQAAIETIEAHGTTAQKDTFLPHLIHGNWSGTMNLTEPQAGSDLAAVTTQAIADGDHYLIRGQKIFITYGDHDLTDNIVHLVLARLPEAPVGVKGLSLFLVPKFLPDENGDWTDRNDIETVSLEHKLGIRASPTAVLNYGGGKYRARKGAVGYLIGEAHAGMTYMFTMMNIARLAVGIEGNGVAERAYQQSAQFARTRLQGTAIEQPRGERVPIIHHPDVKRMLMVQKCRIESMRALGLVLGSAIDQALKHPEAAARTQAQALVDILTPIVKGYTTEMGVENVSLALQIHGGMGFIEETGVAQHYRDQRITPIYEGTTGIQALDLVGRKLVRDSGATTHAVIAHIRRASEKITATELRDLQQTLIAALDTLTAVVDEILAMAAIDIRRPAAIADAYLRLWGVIGGGWQLARAAAVAMPFIDKAPFYAEKITTARFYFAHEMPKVTYYQAVIMQSAESTVNLDESLFAHAP